MIVTIVNLANKTYFHLENGNWKILPSLAMSEAEKYKKIRFMTITLCDLNSSVRGRVSSSRKRFWTLLNLNSEVSEPKILLFSYWFFMQIRHRTLPNLNLEVSNRTIFSNISFIPNIWKLN